MPDHSPAVDAAIEGELQLLDPDVRRSPQRVGALLHPEFTEVGASGRYWDRASILALLAEKTGAGVRSMTVSRMRGVQLAPDLVHLTFDTDNNGRCAHRSSLWRRSENGWQLYFHQGTLYTSETPPAF